MRRAVEGAPSYGFRPLSSTETKELLNIVHQGIVQHRLIDKFLEKKPVPTWELESSRPDAVLSGPLIAHPNLSSTSKSQRALESRLAVEADKLFRKRHPHRAVIYS